ncbi:MAG: hypothetical protein WCE48_09715 [Steroidobacteraceae bacterium]
MRDAGNEALEPLRVLGRSSGVHWRRLSQRDDLALKSPLAPLVKGGYAFPRMRRDPRGSFGSRGDGRPPLCPRAFECRFDLPFDPQHALNRGLHIRHGILCAIGVHKKPHTPSRAGNRFSI